MLLFFVLLFFGIVGCPSPDNPVNKESFSTPVIAIDGSSTGDQSLAIPEPTTLLLLGTGLIGVGILGRKRFKK